MTSWVTVLRMQIPLEDDMCEETRVGARDRGVSFTQRVRRALARALRRPDADQPWMRFAGIIDDAGPDASRTVDTVVYGRERP